MESPFQETAEISITNRQNHSVRNITVYPRYKQDIIELNKSLTSFKKQIALNSPGNVLFCSNGF